MVGFAQLKRLVCPLFLLKICGLEGAAEHLRNPPDNAEKKDFLERCGLSLFKLLFESCSAQKQDNQTTSNLNKIAFVYRFLVLRLECKMRTLNKIVQSTSHL